MKRFFYTIILYSLIGCNTNNKLIPVPIDNEIFLFDTIMGNNNFFSPDKGMRRYSKFSYSYKDGKRYSYSSDIFFKYKYLYVGKQISSNMIQTDYYINVIDSTNYNALFLYFSKNNLDSINYVQASLDYPELDRDFFGKKIINISEKSTIDTLKKWGFINDECEYILSSFTKR